MSGAAPRFSVLLPTHNRADVLVHAIASVLAQTEPDFELLVVADGCTDLTAEVVAGFADERIRFHDLPKAPHYGYANRNVALRQARGRLIAFAAHDDLLLPDHLERMGALLDRSGAAWGYSRPAWVSTDGVIVPFGTNLGFADEMRAFMERGNTIPAACVVHTRDVLERVGFWPEDVPAAADWVLWHRMIAASGGRAAHLPVPTNLHFSADWKKSRFSASGEVQRLVEIADAAPWWPPILRQPPDGGTEQAAVWRIMSAGGTAWVEELRAALDAVLDRLGWACLHPPGIGDEALFTARDRLSAERDAAMAASFDARAEQAEAIRQRDHVLAERDAALLARDAMQAERDRAMAECEAARTELNATRNCAEQALAAIRRSTSWRVTAPMRAVMGRLRGD